MQRLKLSSKLSLAMSSATRMLLPSSLARTFSSPHTRCPSRLHCATTPSSVRRMVSGAQALGRAPAVCAGRPPSVPALSGAGSSRGIDVETAPESLLRAIGAGEIGAGETGAGVVADGGSRALPAPAQLAISVAMQRRLSSRCMFRPARVEECELLSDLAFRSKAIWGYSPEFMEKCRGELTISEDFLKQNLLELMEVEGDVVGFYSLERLSIEVVELGHLFVEPAWLRRGYGRRLLERALRKARDHGFSLLRIQGDPNAAPFYEEVGARRVGERESDSVPGRMLPLFEIAVP